MQKSPFFAPQNRIVLRNVLFNDFKRRNNIVFTDTLTARLDRTLDHYMKEVHAAQPTAPVPFLNKETLTITVQDFAAYLKRTAGGTVEEKPTLLQPKKKVGIDITAAGVPKGGTLLSDLQQEINDQRQLDLTLDTGSLFERIQKERINGEGRPNAPPAPDFRISLDENSPPALELYEMAKKAREHEIKMQQKVAPTPIDNPTTIQPTATMEQHQVLIKKDDIIKYKEIENNLIIYSADRDWLRQTQENRYNFTVNFDPANNPHGFGINPTTQHKFKNITRIEFVKAIIAAESIDIVQRRQDISTSDTALNINVLSLPYVRLHINELEGNNYGTSNDLDHTFGILQYDAVWTSDIHTGSRGFTAMVPKFMKCERKYAPTPLSTLQKLSIQLQRPEGGLVSVAPDTVDVSQIIAGVSLAASPTIYRTAAGDSAYYFIKTKQYFNHLTAQAGDRILFKNITIATGTSTQQTRDEFQGFITGSEGHLIVGVAYDGSGVIDGWNSVGYANYIIIRAAYNDPTTGSVAVRPFGGSSGENAALAADLLTASTGGRGLNLNHQLQLVFRIITRELDSSTRVRPDNL
jgi:hypothetical protein